MFSKLTILRRARIIVSLALSMCLLTFNCSGASAQDAVWSSMYDVAKKAFDDEDLSRAEKLALETVEEAESLPKEGSQLVKVLELLKRIYIAEKKTDEADKVATRIAALGGQTKAAAEKEKSGEPEKETKAASNLEFTIETKPVKTGSEKLADRGRTNDSASKGLTRRKDSEASNRASEDSSSKTKADAESADSKPNSTESKKESSRSSGSDDNGELAIERELKNSTVAANTISPVKTEGFAQNYKLKEVLKLEGHMGWSKCIDISADAKQALSGSADNTVRLWDLTTGKEVQKLEGHDDSVNSVAFSPTGDRALSGSSDKTVRLWDLESGTLIKKLVGHENLVTCVAFAPIGTLAASGGYDGTIRIWDTQTGKEVTKLEGNLGTVKCLAFTPEADEIATGGTDKVVTLWNVKTGKKIRSFSGHTAEVDSVSIADDGSRLVSGGRDTTVRLWDIDSGEELKSMTGHTNWVIKVRFISVDKVISGSLDKTFRIWDVDEGKEDRIFNLQHFGMWSLGFSELGDKAITGSDDFTLRVWQMKP